MGGRSIRMNELLPMLGLDPARARVLKQDTQFAEETAAAEPAGAGRG